MYFHCVQGYAICCSIAKHVHIVFGGNTNAEACIVHTIYSMHAVIVVRLVPYIVFSGLLALTNPGNKRKKCVFLFLFFFLVVGGSR